MEINYTTQLNTLHFYTPLSGTYIKSIFQVKYCKNVEKFKTPLERGVEKLDLAFFHLDQAPAGKK